MKKNTVFAGSLAIGGAPVSVQSMANTKTTDKEATLNQIMRLYKAGCQLVRLSVPDAESAQAFSYYKQHSPVPLAADVHFDVRLAVLALENGADKLRINPGNLPKNGFQTLVSALKAHPVPVRIGVNGGSLEKHLLQKHGGVTPQALAESALTHVHLLEDAGITQIVISVKVSDVRRMIAANRLLAALTPHPIHLGVTEAGLAETGIIKNAIGIGTLLQEGVGDTLRVSLTGDPVPEVFAGIEILRSLGLWNTGIEFIACPTCARTDINVEEIVRRVQAETSGVTLPLKVAVMGCVVNGPGEAREADIGLAGGKGKAALFQKGQLLASGETEAMVALLIEKLKAWG